MKAPLGNRAVFRGVGPRVDPLALGDSSLGVDSWCWNPSVGRVDDERCEDASVDNRQRTALQPELIDTGPHQVGFSRHPTAVDVLSVPKLAFEILSFFLNQIRFAFILGLALKRRQRGKIPNAVQVWANAL